MQIYGPGPIQGSQSVGSLHALRATHTSEVSRATVPQDAVEISEMGQLLESLNQVSDMRMDRINQIRSAIASGSYETEERLSVALNRLLDEIG
jgi:negative regulator of flagellin synthesis FlgM